MSRGREWGRQQPDRRQLTSAAHSHRMLCHLLSLGRYKTKHCPHMHDINQEVLCSQSQHVVHCGGHSYISTQLVITSSTRKAGTLSQVSVVYVDCKTNRIPFQANDQHSPLTMCIRMVSYMVIVFFLLSAAGCHTVTPSPYLCITPWRFCIKRSEHRQMVSIRQVVRWLVLVSWLGIGCCLCTSSPVNLAPGVRASLVTPHWHLTRPLLLLLLLFLLPLVLHFLLLFLLHLVLLLLLLLLLHPCSSCWKDPHHGCSTDASGPYEQVALRPTSDQTD